jgi:hypothetical protein
MKISEHWQSELIGTDDRWGELYVSNVTASASVVPSVSGNGFYATVPAVSDQQNTVVAAIHDAPFSVAPHSDAEPLCADNTRSESGATPMCSALDPTPHSAVINTIRDSAGNKPESRCRRRQR